MLSWSHGSYGTAVSRKHFVALVCGVVPLFGWLCCFSRGDRRSGAGAGLSSRSCRWQRAWGSTHCITGTGSWLWEASQHQVVVWGGKRGPDQLTALLSFRWALWFFKNDKSKMWQANLRLVTKFSTVEDFWA